MKDKVFISSAQKELEAERLALLALLTTDPFLKDHVGPVLFERLPPASRPTGKPYLDALKRCQKVILPGPNGDYARLRVPADARGFVPPSVEAQLNDRQKQIMVEVQRQGVVTSGWCLKTLGITYNTAYLDLSGLVQKGTARARRQGARDALQTGCGGQMNPSIIYRRFGGIYRLGRNTLPSTPGGRPESPASTATKCLSPFYHQTVGIYHLSAGPARPRGSATSKRQRARPNRPAIVRRFPRIVRCDRSRHSTDNRLIIQHNRPTTRTNLPTIYRRFDGIYRGRLGPSGLDFDNMAEDQKRVINKLPAGNRN